MDQPPVCTSPTDTTPALVSVFAKNARLNSDLCISQVLGELSILNWDIVFFSETHAVTNDLILDGGHRLVLVRGDYTYAGVSILIHKKHVANIKRIHAISDRLCAIDVRISDVIVRCIAVYAPHAGFAFDEFTLVMGQLSSLCQHGKNYGTRLIIGGDFQFSDW